MKIYRVELSRVTRLYELIKYDAAKNPQPAERIIRAALVGPSR